MDNAIYITVSRQTGLSRELDVIANNVANANTIGFKGNSVLFRTYMYPPARSSKEPLIAFAQDITTLRKLDEGPFKVTDRTFDVAISGEGFFTVQTPLGIRYTRAGNFTKASDGTLTTMQGYPVLNADGEPIVFEETATDIVFRENGLITAGQQEVGQIAVVTFANPQFLDATGNSLYRSDVAPTPSNNFRLAQRVLEQSNVEPTKQITDLIEVQRSFTGASNLVSSLDELERNVIRTLTKQN